ncbi:MAG: DegT/DnrJ/EryC1/StrS family aminotransferase [bacterium]
MKKIHSVKDLAVCGAPPAFDAPLHVGRPNVGNRERLLARINDMLDRRWFSNHGPFVEEFERKVEMLLGVKHCIAMCNGTVALEIAIRALELKGEVIVPSFTFIATAHALQWQEITPVFADIDPGTHNLDPVSVEKMITPRTTGIIGVHLWGRPSDATGLQSLADKHGLTLMFDASHAFACSHQGRMIGNFGECEVFSFHATKFFNTFEGGAVVTNNDALADKIRLMKNFGFSGYDNVIYIGTNGKMTEICAAMGLTGLESLDEFVQTNRRNYQAYRSEMAGIPGVKLVAYNDQERCNYQYIIVEVDERLLGISRDELVRILHAENILARRYFFPGCHNMQPYKSLFPHVGLLLPNTECLSRIVLALPTGTSVSDSDIAVIASVIRNVATHGLQVRMAIRRNTEQ